MISTRSAGLLIDTVVCLTLAKWETVSGRFGGYLTSSWLHPSWALDVYGMRLLTEPLQTACQQRGGDSSGKFTGIFALDAVCSLGVDLLAGLAASAMRKSKKVNSLINVLIRLVGGTLKLALSKNCDMRKEFQRASARRSLRMSAVVLRRYRRRPEIIFQVTNQHALN